MAKILNSRLFRFLVCLILVCCILVNISPLRAEAVAASAAVASTVAAFGVLCWFTLNCYGMVYEPTQEIVEKLGRSADAFIDDWLVEAADDAAAASEAYRQAQIEILEWAQDPSGYSSDAGDSGDSTDPDWGVHFDGNGSVAIGNMLAGALLRWAYDIAQNDAVEVEEEVEAEEGYVYAGDLEIKEIPAYDMDAYPFITMIYEEYYDRYAVHLTAAPLRAIFSSSSSTSCSIVGSSNCDGIYGYYYPSNSSWGSFKSGGFTTSGGWTEEANIVFTNYDIEKFVGSISWDSGLGCAIHVGETVGIYQSGQNISLSTTESIVIEPSTTFGEIPDQIKAGIYDQSNYATPSVMDLSEVISASDSVYDDMQQVYEQIYNQQISYNDYIQQITYSDSVVDPGDSSGSESGSESGDDSETQPDETEPEEEETTNKFTLDIRDYFPFCIPFDIINFFSILVAEPEAPVFYWELQDLAGNTYPVEVDLSPWDPLAAFLRDLQFFLFLVGLAWCTNNLIKW